MPRRPGEQTRQLRFWPGSLYFYERFEAKLQPGSPREFLDFLTYLRSMILWCKKKFEKFFTNSNQNLNLIFVLILRELLKFDEDILEVLTSVFLGDLSGLCATKKCSYFYLLAEAALSCSKSDMRLVYFLPKSVRSATVKKADPVGTILPIK